MWPKEADRLKKHRGGRGETCTVWISVFSYADARTFSNHGQSRPQNPEQLCVCMCVCTCARVWIPMFVFHPAILLKKQWAEVKVNHSSPGYAIGLTKEDRDHFPHLGQDDTQRDHYICVNLWLLWEWVYLYGRGKEETSLCIPVWSDWILHDFITPWRTVNNAQLNSALLDRHSSANQASFADLGSNFDTYPFLFLAVSFLLLCFYFALNLASTGSFEWVNVCVCSGHSLQLRGNSQALFKQQQLCKQLPGVKAQEL